MQINSHDQCGNRQLIVNLIADSGFFRHRSLRDRIEKHFERGPKASDWEVLFVLTESFLKGRAVAVTEIPPAAGLSEATARRRLRALEAAGAVALIADDEDHRRRIVTLSEPIRNEIRAFVDKYEAEFRNLIDAHDRSDRKGSLTETQVTREELLEYQIYLQQIQEIANIGFWVYDYRTQRYLFGQRERLIGFGIAMADYADDDPDRYYDDDLLTPEDRVRYRELVDEAIATGGPTDFSFRIERADGVLRHIHEMSIPVFDENGELARAAGVMWDMTERFGHERAAAQLRGQLLRQYARSPDPVFILDVPSGRLTFVNDAFCAFFGKPAKSVTGRQLPDFLSVREQRALGVALAELDPDAPEFAFETAIRSRDAGETTVDWTGLGIFSGEDRLLELHAAGVARNGPPGI